MGGGGSKEFDYKNQLLNDHKPQATFAKGTAEADDVTDSLRHPSAQGGFAGYLTGEDEKEELDNCIKGLIDSANKYPKRNCIGWRPFTGKNERGDYVFQSYADTVNEVRAVGKGIYDLLQVENANVGIYGGNRPEWMLSAFGLYSQKYRSVALYDTLGQEAVEYILGHAELVAICCEKNKLSKLFKSVQNASEKEGLPLKHIIVWDYQEKYGNKHESISDEERDNAKNMGLNLIGFSEIIAAGLESAREMQVPTPDDIAYIMYTSGTTGLPKGVLLSHGNFAATVGSVFRWLGPILGDGVQTHVSFLPLAHSFEALMHQVIIIFGGTIAYQQGNIKKLTDDWLAIRPTIIAGVPRVYQKIYDKIQNKVANGKCIKRWAFNHALGVGKDLCRVGKPGSKRWDGKVWTKVRGIVGWDNVRMLVSGAAPLPPYLGEFLKVMSNAHVVQGYGMTETTALGTAMQIGDPTVGHCGIPFDNVEVRLQSVEEMKYTIADTIEDGEGRVVPAPRGEIQMRGPSIFKGYYKAEDKTAETINKDGWILTGDIGRINPNGTVSIIDRKKNIFKTAFGEYIASEKIEGEYGKAAAVGQMWIYGNSFKTKILAVVVPDAVWAVGVLKEAGAWPEGDELPATPEFAKKFNEIAANNLDLLKTAVLEEMRKVEAPLKKIERPSDIIIEATIDELMQGFNVDNGCLTPTFKLRRPQLLEKYRDTLKDMYTKLGEAPKGDENW